MGTIPNKTPEQWARVNALRERGVHPRGAPTARVAQARATEQARRHARKGRS